MRHLALPYHFTRPPQALRKAKLGNIALVPASMLFHKATYTATANKLPSGSVLIVRQNKQRKVVERIIESVSSYFQGHGHQVTTLPSSQFLAS